MDSEIRILLGSFCIDLISSGMENLKVFKKTRPSPRKPCFLVNNEPEIFSDKSDSNFLSARNRNNTLKNISIQTEGKPENLNEIFRKDSAVDVNDFNLDEISKRKAKIEKDDFIPPERFLENYANFSFINQSKTNFKSPQTNRVESEWQINHEKVRSIAEQLAAFQESKIRHHKNLERLRNLQIEVDRILQSPTNSLIVLTKKISEIESLGKEIIDFNLNLEARKKDMELISQELIFFI